jgi:hypothetical protein
MAYKLITSAEKRSGRKIDGNDISFDLERIHYRAMNSAIYNVA